jgi:membrane protein
VEVSRWSRFWWLFRRAFITVYEDNCFSISKGAAYSALLAFFPVLTTLATILVQAKARQVSQIIARFLFEVVPPGTEDLVLRQFAVRGERPASLLVGAGIISLWAASGLMISLIEGFNAVYRIPSNRPFLRQRGVAILLVFAGAVPVLGASALIVFGTRTEESLVRLLGVNPLEIRLVPWILLFGQATRYIVALGAIVLGTASLYKIGPNRPQTWRNAWPGAFLVTLLWLITTSVFAWYMRNMADYNLLYGSIGAVIALIVWMYVLVLIALFGCAFNAERERLSAAA